MTQSTVSRTLWTMRPSYMSYRDHGKPHLPSFHIRISTLLGPILTTYLPMTTLQDLSITQLWNVLLHHFCRVVWSCLIAVLLPVCRASSRLRDRTSFGRYDRGIHLAMAVTLSVTRPLTF